jgi:hypothetical protein
MTSRASLLPTELAKNEGYIPAGQTNNGKLDPLSAKEAIPNNDTL